MMEANLTFFCKIFIPYHINAYKECMVGNKFKTLPKYAELLKKWFLELEEELSNQEDPDEK